MSFLNVLPNIFRSDLIEQADYVENLLSLQDNFNALDFDYYMSIYKLGASSRSDTESINLVWNERL